MDDEHGAGDGRRWRIARAVLLVAAAVLLFARLGANDLWAPDEPRYGQIAEELRSMRHGAEGLVLLHLNDQAYTQKPPLYYWLAALTGVPGGHVSELAARLPSALAGLLIIALTLGLGTRLVGAPSALLGAALLLTTFEFSDTARRAHLDVLLALLEMIALTAFWRLDRGWGRRNANVALLHGAMGLAVLTKGPVGVIIPLLVIAGFLAWERRLPDMRRALPAWGLALSLAPGLLWIAAATLLAPAGFFEHAVGENLLGRFFAGTSHERPLYYYLYQLPADLLPWTLVWPVAWMVGRRRIFAGAAAPEIARAWRFLLAWVGAPLLFFSLSSGKRGIYMLPAFPAVALLCGDALYRHLHGRSTLPRAVNAGALGLAALVAAGGLAVGIVDPPAGVEIPLAFGLALTATGAVSAAVWQRLSRTGAPALARVAVAVAFFFGVLMSTFTLLFPALDPEKSPRPVARAAAELAPPGEPIGLVGSSGLLGGLRYYGDRPVRPLATPASIRAYVESGGRAIVVKADEAEDVTSVAAVEVHASARSGDRKLLVLAPRDAGAAAARRTTP